MLSDACDRCDRCLRELTWESMCKRERGVDI